MDHEYINKLNLVDQYLLGKLATDEAEEFEAHFVDCAECVEQLNISRNFIHDLKRFAAQETLRSTDARSTSRRRGFLGQLTPFRVATALTLVIVGVFGFIGVRRLIRLETEVRQAKQETSDLTARYQRELGTATEAEAKSQRDKQELSQRVSELEKKLGEVNAPPGQVTPPDQGPDAGEVNFPIVALVSVSRGQPANAVNVVLSDSTPKFALSVPIEDPRDFSTYRVKIVNGRGATIWNRSGFKPDGYHALSMSLKSSLVPAGSYVLSVEGLAASGQWTIVGNYPFGVARTRR